MTNGVPTYGNEGEAPRRSRGLARWVILGAVCALVIGFFAWSAESGLIESHASRPDDTYYNLLVRGFRAGQLNLIIEPPPGFTQLADPYDPVANRGYRLADRYPLHDLSYYKGKLYMYFGVTPALVLFWPYAVLTGQHLFHREGVVVFCAVGFLASAGLLCAVWRRCFPEIGLAVVAAGTLALGLASFIPIVLPRCDVYEVAISCGYALTMLALAALWGALNQPHRQGLWLAAASLAYGLAAGARPSLVFGAVILFVPVVHAWRERRHIWVPLLAAAGPITLVGLGLMLYNTLRFDNPLEFGVRYEMPSFREGGLQHFGLCYAWFNLRVFLLEPARWNIHFPFVHDIAVPPLPAGHAGAEHPFGILTNIPLVWLAVAAPLAWRGRSADLRSALRGFLAAAALLFAACALTFTLYFSACARYEMEFVPALVLLAVVGIFGLERALAGRPAWRRAARWVWGLLLVFSVAFNLFASAGRQAEKHLGLGNLFLDRGQTTEAIAQFQEALAIQSDYASAHNNLGVALLRQGQTDEAIRQYQEAVRLGPDGAEAHYNLGAALLKQGQIDEAIRQCQETIRLKPDYAEAHNNLGAAFGMKGRFDEAIRQYQEALRVKPDYADACFNFANALFMKGRVDEAIRQYQEALRLNPDYAEAHNNLGIALGRKGQTDEAIRQYQEALRLKPDYAEAHNNLGNAVGRKGQPDEAIHHFQEALRLNPDYAEAHSGLGAALAQKGRLDEAIGQYQEALRLKPADAEVRGSLGYLQTNYTEVLGNLAGTLEGQGKYAEAIQFYRAALKARPEQEGVLNNLAWLLATCPEAAFRNGAEAVRLATRACERTGYTQPLLIGTLAAAQAEAGDFPAAIATAERAAALATDLRLEEVAAKNRELLQLYRQGQPFHEKKGGE